MSAEPRPRPLRPTVRVGPPVDPDLAPEPPEPPTAGALLGSPWLLGLMLLANICDWAATVAVTTSGLGSELNPFARLLFERAGPLGVLGVKLLFVGFASLLLRRVSRLSASERLLISAGWLLAAVAILLPTVAIGAGLASLLRALP